MSRIYSSLLFIPFILSILLIYLTSTMQTRAAPHLSGRELIDLVNQLRLANGLPAYQVNQALMAAAQAHSDYQASIGQVTHTGQGGTRPRERAIAYGYGGGGTIFVSENIAGGSKLSASEAVSWWQGDSLHLNTMLGANYTDAGAGVAEADGRLYYTLDVGYVAGEAGSAPSPGGSAAAKTPAATLLAVIPVKASTPNPDGSIVHVVQPGQALWNIAAVYKVKLADLLALNGLTQSSLIYPGDKILVQPAQPTSTPTASEIPTSTITPTPTKRPTHTATPLSTTALASTPLTGNISPAAGQNTVKQEPAQTFDPLLLAIIALVIVGSGLIAFGSLLKKPPN